MMKIQKNGKIQWVVLTSFCLIGIVMCGGCTDSAPQVITDDDITVIPNTVEPTSSIGKQVYGNIVIDVPEFSKHWKPDGSCYWEGRISVTNIGETPEMNIIIRSYLNRVTDDKTEYVDSKSFQRINGQESLTYVSQLFGTCDEEYYIYVKADTE